ncbi:MAG: RsmD family RNA methyltransferase [Methanomassiliicoccales archaeon]
MRRTNFLFELSGEHPSLPLAELNACLFTICKNFEFLENGPGFAIVRMDENDLYPTISRLALTHRVGEYLGSCRLDELKTFLIHLEIGPGSAAVRVKRYGGAGSPELANNISRCVGEVISRTNKIDLTEPEQIIRVILGERLHFHIEKALVDRDQFERRHVRSRPFFSPVSLHPCYARALVNLTRIRPGETLLDPFCGTGGIVLEASLMGVRVIGTDASKEMIEGCKANLEHFGAPWLCLERMDVGEVVEKFYEVDAVATDPPYGRSATTLKESVETLHKRGLEAIGKVLKSEGRAGIILPYQCNHTASLFLEQTHVQRVHRSLQRHYCLLRRRGL